MPNRNIICANGKLITVKDQSVLEKELNRLKEENTIGGVEPDMSTVAVEISQADLETNSWYLIGVRDRRMYELFGEIVSSDGSREGEKSLRGLKLKELDDEWAQGGGPKPGVRSKAVVETERQTLRDLRPTVETHLDTLTTVSAVRGYTPPELA